MRSFLMSLLFFSCFSAFRAEKVLVRWDFSHVKEGYDYDSRMEFFVDGSSIGYSDIFKLTAKGSANLDLPKGNYALRVVSYVFYKGEWEMQSLANDYSVDASALVNIDPEKKNLLTLHFDITRNKVRSALKHLKHPEIDRATDYKATLDWKFENVQSGYDTPVVFWIYVDGRLDLITEESLQSAGRIEVIPLTRGKHEIRMECYVKTKDGLEPYLVKTGYEFDAVAAFDISMKQKVVEIRFDVLGKIEVKR